MVQLPFMQNIIRKVTLLLLLIISMISFAYEIEITQDNGMTTQNIGYSSAIKISVLDEMTITRYAHETEIELEMGTVEVQKKEGEVALEEDAKKSITLSESYNDIDISIENLTVDNLGSLGTSVEKNGKAITITGWSTENNNVGSAMIYGNIKLILPEGSSTETTQTIYEIRQTITPHSPDYFSNKYEITVITEPTPAATVSVGNIDLGKQIAGVGEVTGSSSIAVNTIGESEITYEIISDNSLKLNCDESVTIDFESKVTGDLITDSDGNANAILNVTVDILEDATAGHYTGEVKINVSHN